MRKQVFSVTPSFLLKLMKQCSSLEDNAQIFEMFEKISNSSAQILTGEDLDQLEQEAEDGLNYPEHLEDLKNALEGAVDENEEEAEDSAHS